VCSSDLRAARTGSSYERYGPGVNHVGFAVPTEAEFEAIRSALEQAGVDVPDTQDFGEALAMFLPDPDGLRIEITWYRDGG